MVLLNRKKVQPDEKELSVDVTGKKVWIIKETGERITDYDSYQKRLKFYKRKIFTCEVTGRDAITYFKALKSEERHRKDVDSFLSRELRVAIANYVNFNSIRNVPELVARTYQRFSNRFFIHEIVCLKNTQRRVLIPLKVKRGNSVETQIGQSNGNFFVVKDVFRPKEMLSNEMEEILESGLSLYVITEFPNQNPKGRALIASQNEITRPASRFSRFLVACFLNEILIKASNKKYAPWRVKQKYVEAYDINPNCPPEMVKYLPDEENQVSRKLYTPLTIPLEEDTGSVDSEERPLSKKQKMGPNMPINYDQNYDTIKCAGHNSIKRGLDDKELPFTGPSTPFKSISYIDSSLEYKPVDWQSYGESARFSTERLLIVYQFLNSFGPFIGLTHFNFDQFLTSIKCIDPEFLVDECVKISFIDNGNNVDSTKYEKSQGGKYGSDTKVKVSQQKRVHISSSNEDHFTPSNLTRNQVMRDFIAGKSTKLLNFSIFRGEPIKNDNIDVYSYDRAGDLYIEIVCSLMCLIIDEKEDWTCGVMEDWIEDKRKGEEDKTVAEGVLKKYLNYGNTNWTKLLSGRNFKNSNWLICLLGVLQDSMHITPYREIVQHFIEKILPSATNFRDSGEELWQNFCDRLSTKNKIDILWLLVDLVSNFSSYIKELVDGTPRLCNAIRLKLYGLEKEYHQSTNQLKNASKKYFQLSNTPSTNNCALHESKKQIDGHKIKMARLTEDISYLEAKLIQSDVRRLEILGKDRYGNKYYWMDSQVSSLSICQKDEGRYSCCFLWIQGPSEEDVAFYLDVDKESLRKWKLSAEVNGTAHATKQVFSIYRSADGSYFHTVQGEDVMIIDSNGILMQSTVPEPIYKKIITETPEHLLLSPHQWVFFNDVQDIHMLMDRLENLGDNEWKLKKTLTTKMDRIEASYKHRLSVKMCNEFDRAFKRNYKLWKANEFTPPELKRIEAFSMLNSEDVLNIEKLVKELSTTYHDAATKGIMKGAASLGESERAFFKKQHDLIYPLDFHLEQLSTTDERFIFEMKKKKQEEILTILLNHQRHNYIRSTSSYKRTFRQAKVPTRLNVDDMLEDIKSHLISGHSDIAKS